MRKIYLTLTIIFASVALYAQSEFDLQLDRTTTVMADTVIMPASPLKTKVLFVGGVDRVQTTPTYSNAAGETFAKEWHDFIGVTPDDENPWEYWISVNHEMTVADDSIGDGGGMTVFKISVDENTGEPSVLEQSIPQMDVDGPNGTVTIPARTGKFFNVDFANTVGETGMNCGGISSIVDGRIWTAEEWWRGDAGDISFDRNAATQFIIQNTGINGTFDGESIERYENYNYMVEIDPRNAVAVRKQYNWGRQPFEGGTLSKDNTTVYLGTDDTPGFFTKFVASTPGDFTDGTLYVYKQDNTQGNRWVAVDNTDISKMLDFETQAKNAGGTMFNRLEWVTIDPVSEKIYIAETGRDNPGSRWNGFSGTNEVAAHHSSRATLQGVSDAFDANYTDYYGRVLEYDPATEVVRVYLEGGPEFATAEGQSVQKYPAKHLSNPDGLGNIVIGSQSYLLIQEDINGRSHNRMPYAIGANICEIYLLDLSITNPTIDNLVKLTAVPYGAEVTGATSTPDGKLILLNSQHPNSSTDINTYPYNHSLTLAIYGFDESLLAVAPASSGSRTSSFFIYPNPTAREVHFNKVTDAAIYDITGKRVKVVTDSDFVNVADLEAGEYFIKNKEGETVSLIVQ